MGKPHQQALLRQLAGVYFGLFLKHKQKTQARNASKKRKRFIFKTQTRNEYAKERKQEVI